MFYTVVTSPAENYGISQTAAETAELLAGLALQFGRPTVTETDLYVTTHVVTDFHFVGALGTAHVSVFGVTANELRDAYRAAQAARVARRVEYCSECGAEFPHVDNTCATVCPDCSERLAEIEWDLAAAEPVAEPAGVLSDGTYTLVYDGDSYFTFRIRELHTGRLSGRRVVEYLSGPDNSLDFTTFGFVNNNTINVWRRYERGSLVNRAREIEAMSRNDRDALESAGLRYAERSGRCRRCNRVLTVPASLAAGFGPDCAAILGVAYGETVAPSRRRRRTEETIEPEVETRETTEDTCVLCGDPLNGYHSAGVIGHGPICYDCDPLAEYDPLTQTEIPGIGGTVSYHFQ